MDLRIRIRFSIVNATTITPHRLEENRRSEEGEAHVEGESGESGWLFVLRVLILLQKVLGYFFQEVSVSKAWVLLIASFFENHFQKDPPAQPENQIPPRILSKVPKCQ